MLRSPCFFSIEHTVTHNTIRVLQKKNLDTMLVYICEQGKQLCQLRDDFFGDSQSDKNIVVNMMTKLAQEYAAGKFKPDELKKAKEERVKELKQTPTHMKRPYAK